MKQTPAAARERREDALHRLPETIDQFEATFAELREIIEQQAAAINDLYAKVYVLTTLGITSSNPYRPNDCGGEI